MSSQHLLTKSLRLPIGGALFGAKPHDLPLLAPHFGSIGDTTTNIILNTHWISRRQFSPSQTESHAECDHSPSSSSNTRLSFQAPRSSSSQFLTRSPYLQLHVICPASSSHRTAHIVASQRAVSANLTGGNPAPKEKRAHLRCIGARTLSCRDAYFPHVSLPFIPSFVCFPSSLPCLLISTEGIEGSSSNSFGDDINVSIVTALQTQNCMELRAFP